MQYQQLRPRQIVDYFREAYIFPAGNVRVTIDSDIRSLSGVTGFLDPGAAGFPLSGQIVLEVKFDDFLPDIIKNAVSMIGRQSSAFSKYAGARLI